MTTEIGPLIAPPSFLDDEDSQPISRLEAVSGILLPRCTDADTRV
ncbi:hypothetical protein [Mycobacterium sp.]